MVTQHPRIRLFISALLPSFALACQSGASTASDAGVSSDPDSAAPVLQSFALTITAVDTTFVTRDHFMAAVEMQLSGEPFAEAMGRDLAGYSRDFSCQACTCDPSLYHDPALNGGVAGGHAARDDLPGFSSGVESYEYSKQPMNNIAFESGAGTAARLRAGPERHGRDRSRRAAGAPRLGPAPGRRQQRRQPLRPRRA